MMAEIIDGKAFAAKLREKIKIRTAQFQQESGIHPGLAVILVGHDPASEVYVRNKKKAAEEVGFLSREYLLSADVAQSDLRHLIEKLNNDPQIHGILLQLPLPSGLDSQQLLSAISPDKDVDGFHALNSGKLWNGEEALVACTPLGCSLLLRDRLGDDLNGARALIIGRSNIVGKPMAALLLAMNATVTMAHSRTRNLSALCAESDIVIAAIGRAEYVRGHWLKPGSIVLDVGINRVDVQGKKKLVGDVEFAEAIKRVAAITPVPGGIGPMTIACLLRNTLQAAENAYRLSCNGL